MYNSGVFVILAELCKHLHYHMGLAEFSLSVSIPDLSHKLPSSSGVASCPLGQIVLSDCSDHLDTVH